MEENTLIKGAIDLMLNNLTTKINQAGNEGERARLIDVISKYIEIRNKLNNE